MEQKQPRQQINMQVKKVWRTGTRTFRLTSNSANSLTGDIFTTAESDLCCKRTN